MVVTLHHRHGGMFGRAPLSTAVGANFGHAVYLMERKFVALYRMSGRRSNSITTYAKKVQARRLIPWYCRSRILVCVSPRFNRLSKGKVLNEKSMTCAWFWGRSAIEGKQSAPSSFVLT